VGFRALTAAVLMAVGGYIAPRPLWPVLVAGLAVDLWLLLPFNRGRGLLVLLVAGALFGLVWAPLGFRELAAVSAPRRALFLRALLQSTAGGLIASLVGYAIARGLERATRPSQPESELTLVPAGVGPLS